MADVTVLGRGVFVRGSVRGEGDLEIQGRVEGEVDVDGEVVVAEGALVKADVSARRIVVRGAIAGALSAREAVRLEEGARLVGDVRAPSFALAEGALMRGQVSSGDEEATARPAKKVAAAPARPAVAPPRAVAAPPPPRPAPAAAPRPASIARPAPAPRAVAAVAAHAPVEEREGPPPPVVPALRKGAKGALKKKGAR
jgi:cytoskeletal protein CcmA (bactofilin family)